VTPAHPVLDRQVGAAEDAGVVAAAALTCEPDPRAGHAGPYELEEPATRRRADALVRIG
jgi:hypothetical protein